MTKKKKLNYFFIGTPNQIHDFYSKFGNIGNMWYTWSEHMSLNKYIENDPVYGLVSCWNHWGNRFLEEHNFDET